MTHTKDEALKLALEALEAETDLNWECSSYHPKIWEAITAIKQALAAPVQSCFCPNCEAMGKELAALKAQPAPVQQPFCFYYVENGEEYFAPKGAYVPDNAQPLYTTAAQPAVPLTDEQIEDLRGEANRGFCIEREDYFKAFRDAEAAHGITAAAPEKDQP